MDYSKFEENYYSSTGKFVDFFQKGINTLPFNSTPASLYDKSCGLSGVAGEFFRKASKSSKSPINNFTKDAETPVRSFLKDECSMADASVDDFVEIMRDIIYPDNKFSVIETAFLKYVPLIDETINKALSKKYMDGQRKIADYLYSMLKTDFQVADSDSPNLFSNLIRKSLDQGFSEKSSGTQKEYYALPFISKGFNEDLSWLMTDHDDYVIVKYINYLLHFYACFSVTQTIIKMDQDSGIDKPQGLYYILVSESASAKKEVVTAGWEKFVKGKLPRLFGRAQAIDIANTLLGGNVGILEDILTLLAERDFASDKETCEMVLRRYQEDKRALLLDRDTVDEMKLGEPIDTSVSSYKEFLDKLTKLCVELQSTEYARLGGKVTNLMKVKFLQSRRGNDVLVLDEEMLVFLIAMFTHEKKTKLDDMYKLFNAHGMYFNIETRNLIEQYLLKSNLLDRKSDSGETQYVTVIL
ncbi:MAG: DNA phosphorothioation-dependent restriction protein DptG [Bacteroidales bacterium]|nr:DNA phosphorothioation-dependent restriction protein DptG [Bacteroidales bacterium]